MSETNEDNRFLVAIKHEPVAVRWAKHEVEVVMQRIAERSPDTRYDQSCYDAALAAFETLCKQGHTGYSFTKTFAILDRMCRRMPLCPIEDRDFPQHGTRINDGRRGSIGNGIKLGLTSYQCPRMTSFFKDVWDDGVITYHDNNRMDCCNTENINDIYYWGFAAKIIDEMYPIKLPYYPDPNHHFRVYVTQFTVDNMDVCAIDRIVEPSGVIVDVDRYFKYTDIPDEDCCDFVEITKEEYEEFKANRDVSVESMYANFIINDLIDYQDELKDGYSRLKYKEVWDGHDNNAYNKYNLRNIWWALMRKFKDSEEVERIFDTIKKKCGVFVVYPDAGWDIVSTLCSPVTADAARFVDKHPEFCNLAETIQNVRTRIHEIITQYITQMDEFGDKIIGITGETPERTIELRIEAIKEITHELEPNQSPDEEDQTENIGKETDECDCGCSCGCC